MGERIHSQRVPLDKGRSPGASRHGSRPSSTGPGRERVFSSSTSKTRILWGAGRLLYFERNTMDRRGFGPQAVNLRIVNRGAAQGAPRVRGYWHQLNWRPAGRFCRHPHLWPCARGIFSSMEPPRLAGSVVSFRKGFRQAARGARKPIQEHRQRPEGPPVRLPVCRAGRVRCNDPRELPPPRVAFSSAQA